MNSFTRQSQIWNLPGQQGQSTLSNLRVRQPCMRHQRDVIPVTSPKDTGATERKGWERRGKDHYERRLLPRRTCCGRRSRRRRRRWPWWPWGAATRAHGTPWPWCSSLCCSSRSPPSPSPLPLTPLPAHMCCYHAVTQLFSSSEWLFNLINY